jgi:hypothetical protein
MQAGFEIVNPSVQESMQDAYIPLSRLTLQEGMTLTAIDFLSENCGLAEKVEISPAERKNE